MAEDAWKARLRGRMAELQHNMKSLSLAAGLGETSVRDMLKRTQSPSIDAVAKLAKALDMTLSDLYEGPAENAAVAREICAVSLIGESSSNKSAWFELVGNHSIAIDHINSRLVKLRYSPVLVAIYHLDSIAVFEKLRPEDVEIDDGVNYLILTKDRKRYLGTIISSSEEEGEKRVVFAFNLLLADKELELLVSDIDWIARWKQTLPRVEP